MDEWIWLYLGDYLFWNYYTQVMTVASDTFKPQHTKLLPYNFHMRKTTLWIQRYKYNYLFTIILTATISFSYRGADTRAFDNSGMNPFMIAVEKSHLEVDKEGSWPLSLSVGSELTVIHWALEKGNCNAFFKVCLSILLNCILLFPFPM